MSQRNPLLSKIASSGQTTPQAPQSMQSSGSMTWRSLRSPLIASVGQRLMHAVQPVQFSVMMKGIRGCAALLEKAQTFHRQGKGLGQGRRKPNAADTRDEDAFLAQRRMRLACVTRAAHRPLSPPGRSGARQAIMYSGA